MRWMLCENPCYRLRREFERSIEAARRTDDPLAVWVRYVRWTEAEFPAGGTESGRMPLLERATREFQDDTRYANDPRYITLWVQYADMVQDPAELFKFLHGKGIGSRVGLFFVAWAHVAEHRGHFEFARDVYHRGLRQDLLCQRDVVEQRLSQFEARMRTQWREYLSEMGADPEDPEAPPVDLAALSRRARQESSAAPPSTHASAASAAAAADDENAGARAALTSLSFPASRRGGMARPPRGLGRRRRDAPRRGRVVEEAGVVPSAVSLENQAPAPVPVFVEDRFQDGRGGDAGTEHARMLRGPAGDADFDVRVGMRTEGPAPPAPWPLAPTDSAKRKENDGPVTRWTDGPLRPGRGEGGGEGRPEAPARAAPGSTTRTGFEVFVDEEVAGRTAPETHHNPLKQRSADEAREEEALQRQPLRNFLREPARAAGIPPKPVSGEASSRSRRRSGGDGGGVRAAAPLSAEEARAEWWSSRHPAEDRRMKEYIETVKRRAVVEEQEQQEEEEDVEEDADMSLEKTGGEEEHEDHEAEGGVDTQDVVHESGSEPSSRLSGTKREQFTPNRLSAPLPRPPSSKRTRLSAAPLAEPVSHRLDESMTAHGADLDELLRGRDEGNQGGGGGGGNQFDYSMTVNEADASAVAALFGPGLSARKEAARPREGEEGSFGLADLATSFALSATTGASAEDRKRAEEALARSSPGALRTPPTNRPAQGLSWTIFEDDQGEEPTGGRSSGASSRRSAVKTSNKVSQSNFTPRAGTGRRHPRAAQEKMEEEELATPPTPAFSRWTRERTRLEDESVVDETSSRAAPGQRRGGEEEGFLAAVDEDVTINTRLALDDVADFFRSPTAAAASGGPFLSSSAAQASFAFSRVEDRPPPPLPAAATAVDEENDPRNTSPSSRHIFVLPAAEFTIREDGEEEEALQSRKNRLGAAGGRRDALAPRHMAPSPTVSPIHGDESGHGDINRFPIRTLSSMKPQRPATAAALNFSSPALPSAAETPGDAPALGSRLGFTIFEDDEGRGGGEGGGGRAAQGPGFTIFDETAAVGGEQEGEEGMEEDEGGGGAESVSHSFLSALNRSIATRRRISSPRSRVRPAGGIEEEEVEEDEEEEESEVVDTGLILAAVDEEEEEEGGAVARTHQPGFEIHDDGMGGEDVEDQENTPPPGCSRAVFRRSPSPTSPVLRDRGAISPVPGLRVPREVEEGVVDEGDAFVVESELPRRRETGGGEEEDGGVRGGLPFTVWEDGGSL